jgi:hypothetical protein
MLHEILAIFSVLFKSAEQENLDNYIASKNPTTACEVDYWVRQYDLQQGRKTWL